MGKNDVEFEVRWADIRQADEGSLWVLVTEDRIRLDGWKRDDENDPCEMDHCGTDDCECPVIREEPAQVLERWHESVHAGVYRFCDESPCSELRAVQ